MLGLRDIGVDHPDTAGPVWDEALSVTRPVVIDARTDPNVPPLPAHITFKQAKNFTSAIVKGDIDALVIIRAPLTEEWDEGTAWIRRGWSAPPCAGRLRPYRTSPVSRVIVTCYSQKKENIWRKRRKWL